MTKFEYAINFTLPWEVGREKTGKMRSDGGLNNDDGSITKWGIRQANNPNVNVANLSKDEAIEIYRTKYWLAYNLDQYELGLAVCMFDTGVNQGPAKAKEYYNKCSGSQDVCRDIISLRDDFYRRLANKDKEKYGKFLKGWLARTADLRKYIDIIRVENEPVIHPDDKVFGFNRPKGGRT